MNNKIKNYWEKRTPQPWYSDKKTYTKEFYDDIEIKRYTIYYGYLPRMMEFNQHKGEKVLEIGCGLGTELIQYAKHGSFCTGIDLTENAIKRTSHRFKLYNLKRNFLTANAENLPFKSNSFDLVTSFGVLHHTPKTKKAIQEAMRVVKPNKKAIIMLYSKGVWYFLIILKRYILNGEFLKSSLQKCLNKNSEHYMNCPLTKFYSKKEMKKLVKGYKIIYLKKHGLGTKLHEILPKPIYKIAEEIIGNNWIIKISKQYSSK